MQFYLQGLLVDLSVQSVLGLANSALMARYCAQCPQLRLLARKVPQGAYPALPRTGTADTAMRRRDNLIRRHS